MGNKAVMSIGNVVTLLFGWVAVARERGAGRREANGWSLEQLSDWHWLCSYAIREEIGEQVRSLLQSAWEEEALCTSKVPWRVIDLCRWQISVLCAAAMTEWQRDWLLNPLNDENRRERRRGHKLHGADSKCTFSRGGCCKSKNKCSQTKILTSLQLKCFAFVYFSV